MVSTTGAIATATAVVIVVRGGVAVGVFVETATASGEIIHVARSDRQEGGGVIEGVDSGY